MVSHILLQGLYLLSQNTENTAPPPALILFTFVFIQESLQSTCTSRCCIEIAGRVYSIQTEQSGPLFYL